MANTDKNIIITPSRGSEQDPNIVFSGANATSGPANITATVTPAANGTLTFSGAQGGNLLRIANDLSNTIYTQGNLRVDNTVSANTGAFTNISGNGAGITGILAGNVTGQVANALVAGTVYTNAQPNITSVGTLTSLSATGNANVGNIGATNGVFTNISGNGSSLTAITGANVTGTVANATFATSAGSATTATSATTAGTVTTAAQPNITSVGTLSALSVSGNANVGNIGATNGVFTNVSGNGSALTSITGANVTGQVANALVAGTVYTAAQPNITSVGTLTTLSVTGNANVGNIGATNGVFTNVSGNGASLTAITGANVTGTVANATFATSAGSATTATSATTAGTVTTNAQPNITSVGTLSELSVTGTITGGNLATGGTLSSTGNANVGNLGTAGLITATGNIQGNNILVGTGAGTAAGDDNILKPGATSAFLNVKGGAGRAKISLGNDAVSIIAGSSPITFYANAVNSTHTGTAITTINSTGLSVTGTLSATGNANTGNIGATNGVFTNVSGNGAGLTNITAGSITGQVANALVAGTVYTAAQPNITSVGTLTSLSVTGNSNISNIGANFGYFANDAIVNGNLYVNGNISYLNVETVAVEDPIIQLGTGPNGAAPSANAGKDVGTALNYYDAAAKIAFMGWDVSNAEIAFGSNVSIASEVVTFTQLANTRSGNTLTTGVFASTLSATGNANVGNIGTAGLITATGNINSSGRMGAVGVSTSYGVTTGNSVGAFNGIMGTTTSATWLLSGTSNNVFRAGIQVLDSGGVVRIYEGANFMQFGSNTITITGTMEASRLTSSIATGTAPLVVNSTTQVANLNAATAGSATTAGTVTTAAQGNITSVGTLTSLSVSGNANVGNLGTAGLITADGNVRAGNLLTPGRVGIGTTTVTNTLLNITGAMSGATTSQGASITSEVQSGVTAAARYYQTSAATQATTFTLPLLTHFFASQGTFGAGSTVTTQQGFFVDASLVGAGTNYGFRGQIASGANRFNLYMDGTANNYLAGNLGIANTAPTHTLSVTGTFNLSGNANVGNIGVGIVTATGNITGGNFIGIFANGNSNISIPTAGGNILFATNGTANRMVIKTDGNIGIGTSNPGTLLEVLQTTNTQAVTRIYNSNTQSAAEAVLQLYSGSKFVNYALNGNLNYMYVGGGSVSDIYSDFNTHIWRNTSGSELMRLANIGLGIGTTNPGELLDVVKSANTTGYDDSVTFKTTNNANGSQFSRMLFGQNSTNNLFIEVANATNIKGSLLLQPFGGNVSVNTTSITNTFNVGGTGAFTGNVTAPNFIGNLFGNWAGPLANGTSNVAIPAVNGNVNISVGGNANRLVVTTTGAVVTGTASANGNVTGGNLVTAGTVSATGSLITAASIPVNSTNGGFVYYPHASNHIAYYKKAGTYSYYWRRSDDGQPGGANEYTMMELWDNQILTVGTRSLGDAGIKIGYHGTSNRYAYLDLVGDSTYQDYGLRLIRENGGPNTTSWMQHRGTGTLVITTQESGDIDFRTNSAQRVVISKDGYLFANGNATAIIAGTAANNGVSLQMALNSAIRDVGANSVIYYDAGVGAGSAFGSHILRGSSSYTTYATINSSGLNTDLGLNVGGYTLISGYNSRVGIKFPGGNTQFGLAMQPTTDGTTIATFFNAANGAVGSISQTASNVTWNGLVPGANVTGTVSSATTAGTVTTAAQTNITSVGTLSALSVSGNANVGNLNTTGVVSASRLISTVTTGTAPLSVTSTTQVANLNADLIDGIDSLALARLVCTTQVGGIGAENGANTWSKIATFTTGTNQFLDSTLILAITNNSTNQHDSAIISVFFRSNGTNENPTVDVKMLSKGGLGSGILDDSFKVISGGWNTVMELWMKKGITYSQFAIYEISKQNAGTLSYSLNPAWQSATPTGAVNNVSTDGIQQGLKITAPRFISTVTTGTAPFTVSSTTQVANLNAATAGTAGTVTDGMYITQDQTITGIKRFVNTANTAIANANGDLARVEARGNGTGAAFMQFHRPGSYAGYFGIDTDNLWKVGGWTMGATSYPILHTNNFNSYAPTLTGTGASGTWSINVTGSAGSATTAGTVTTAAQSNITSVGTLTSLSVSGNANVGNLRLNSSGFVLNSVHTGITANGTTQATATALGNAINIVNTVTTTNQGVRLPTAIAGMEVKIINLSANILNVYPATSGIINSLAANATYQLGANGRLEFVATSTTQWYTMTGVYA